MVGGRAVHPRPGLFTPVGGAGRQDEKKETGQTEEPFHGKTRLCITISGNDKSGDGPAKDSSRLLAQFQAIDRGLVFAWQLQFPGGKGLLQFPDFRVEFQTPQDHQFFHQDGIAEPLFQVLAGDLAVRRAESFPGAAALGQNPEVFAPGTAFAGRASGQALGEGEKVGFFDQFSGGQPGKNRAGGQPLIHPFRLKKS